MTDTKENVKGYLIECDGRSLFIRDKAECQWAIDDPEYTVTELVPKGSEAVSQSSDDAERIQLLEEIFTLEEQQIAQMKGSLEQAFELIESIHEFASKKTDNLIELKGLLLLIAESCDKWLMEK